MTNRKNEFNEQLVPAIKETILLFDGRLQTLSKYLPEQQVYLERYSYFQESLAKTG